MKKQSPNPNLCPSKHVLCKLYALYGLLSSNTKVTLNHLLYE